MMVYTADHKSGWANLNRRVRNGVSFAVPPIGALIVGFALWEIVSATANLPEYVLPSPLNTAREFRAQWSLLATNTRPTLEAAVLGFAISVIVGCFIGFIINSAKIFEKTIYPLLAASQAIPKLALAPLFVVWFGFGMTPRIVMTFLLAVFPIVVATVTGLQSVENEYLQLSRSMGLSRLQTFRKIQLPAALPSVFGGLKVAITLAVVGVVVAEFIGSDSGLGNVMLQAISLTNTPLLFAGLIVLTVVALALFTAVEIVERLAIPWHVAQRRTK